MIIPNILAARYASQAIADIWSAEGRVILEREFWIAIMRAQRALGLEIPEEAIDSYQKVKNEVNLASIDARERVTRHDVKARIEEFCELAGYEHIHKALTSRDLTENVEQLQVYRSLVILRDKIVAILSRLSKKADDYRDIFLAARTHNVAAQPTSFGKRIAMFGEELTGSFESLEYLISTYPVRGIKGAVGTQTDLLSLFDQDEQKVAQLESSLLEHLSIPRKMTNVGQVYPRSLDMRVVGLLCELAAPASSFAKTLRLMAGHETASEGFAKGQTGSSAMPHKMNARSCERVNGFYQLLKGYLTMASSLAGDQWNEGDVSCSVVRRVMLPDSFFAFDGLLETFLTILDQMEVYKEVLSQETAHYLPFLMTTAIMMECVKKGMGREQAHKQIKHHAISCVHALRAGDIARNDLFERISRDASLPLDAHDLEQLKSAVNTGNADQQVSYFIDQVNTITKRYPGAENYTPGAIL